MPSILVIEDEPSMRRVLYSALGGQSYEVWEAGNVKEGFSAFLQRAPEVVLLDLGLPDGEGIELLERIRASSEVPIVVISARGEERDQVRALDAGANDYVTKPFREGELLARLRAVLRSAARANRNADETLVIGPLRIECFERRLFVNEVEVELTPKEFSLLQILARYAGRVVTHRKLLCQVWGPAYVEDVHYLRVFMKQLRAKVEPDPSKPKLLVTTAGVGYRLKLPD
jgi:two-component system KDP operon response regulator KdpE